MAVPRVVRRTFNFRGKDVPETSIWFDKAKKAPDLVLPQILRDEAVFEILQAAKNGPVEESAALQIVERVEAQITARQVQKRAELEEKRKRQQEEA
jgi:hypothetical protein